MSAALFENLLPKSSAACLVIAVIAGGVGLKLGGPIRKADASATLVIEDGSWASHDAWGQGKSERSVYVAQSKDMGSSLINGEVSITIKGGVQTSNKLPFQGEYCFELEVSESYEEDSKSGRLNHKATVLRANPEQLLKARSFVSGEKSAFDMFELQFNRQGKAWGFEDGYGRWQAAPSGYSLTPYSLIIALRQKPITEPKILTIYYPIVKDGVMLTAHEARVAKVSTTALKLYQATDAVLCDEYQLSVQGQVVDRYWIEQAQPRRLVQRKTADGRTWLLKSQIWAKK